MRNSVRRSRAYNYTSSIAIFSLFLLLLFVSTIPTLSRGNAVVRPCARVCVSPSLSPPSTIFPHPSKYDNDFFPPLFAFSLSLSLIPYYTTTIHNTVSGGRALCGKEVPVERRRRQRKEERTFGPYFDDRVEHDAIFRHFLRATIEKPR